MIQTPFTTLPLVLTPYFSRINSNYDTALGTVKNYYLTGFKPGFPLQASELNEIQEQFFLQQTLTNTCISNWNQKGAPFWTGATPLSPNYFTAIKSGTSVTITITPGWFYVNIPTSTSTAGFGVWIWNNYQFSQTIDLASTSLYGLYLDNYSVVDYNQDTNLTDNSGGGSSIKTSGADRIKINVIGYSTSDTATVNNLFPIFKIQKRGTTTIYDILTINNGIITSV